MVYMTSIYVNRLLGCQHDLKLVHVKEGLLVTNISIYKILMKIKIGFKKITTSFFFIFNDTYRKL